MNILGCDLSLTGTGYAWGRHALLVAPKTRGAIRLADHRAALERVLTLAQPDCAIIEDYAMGARGRVFDIGELGGVARLTLHDNGIPYICVSPSALKMWSTGKGNSDKDVMLSTAIREFGFEGSNNNTADAWLLMCFGEHLLNEPRAVHYDVSGAQLKALQKKLNDSFAKLVIPEEVRPRS